MKTLVKVPLVLPYAVVELTLAKNAGELDSQFHDVVDAENHARYWSMKAKRPFAVVWRYGVLLLYEEGRLSKFDADWFSDLIEVRWVGN